MIHTEEKPYKCSYCGTAFSSNVGLVWYIKYHNEEIPALYTSYNNTLA